MAGMDVSEKRIPQDGRVALARGGETVDLRISTIPTIHGEKVVVRILGRKGLNPMLGNIGLTAKQQKLLRSQLQAPEGMILICGPTSSGKTTTLYAALSEITSPKKNIVTVEDPVEYALSDVSQVQVNEKAGLDFALCLRAFLRQNPDIIMVGEVRDTLTAQIATRAAMTGHLLLSTIHTIDAAAAPSRLIDMGVEPFLVGTALRVVVAQRLVRRLCLECAAPTTPPAPVLEQLGFEPGAPTTGWHTAVGCPACRGGGYKSQVGVFEVLVVDDAVRAIIGEGRDASHIREYMRNNGMEDLRTQARNLVAAGVTTAEELLRVIPHASTAVESIV